MRILENVIATPMIHVADNNFVGGFYDTAGSFIDECRHQRSTSQDVQFPSSSEPHPRHGDAIKTVSKPCLYGGLCFDHFGHFLIESLGRLWAAAQEEYLDFDIYFHTLWGLPRLDDDSYFTTQILKLLKIDIERVIFITEPTIFENIHVPEQLYGFHLLDRPDARFLNFIHRAEDNEALEESSGLPSKLYVSRSKWKAEKGIVAGEELFDDFLISDGWTVLYPENHTFVEQLRFYKNAKKIIFSEGSAFHSLILLPRLEADVSVIMRRKSGWNNEVLVKQFQGLGHNLRQVQCVRNSISLGLPDYAAVAIIDYHRASLELIEAEVIERSFDSWESKKEIEENKAISRFLEAFKENPILLDFIKHISLTNE